MMTKRRRSDELPLCDIFGCIYKMLYSRNDTRGNRTTSFISFEAHLRSDILNSRAADLFSFVGCQNFRHSFLSLFLFCQQFLVLQGAHFLQPGRIQLHFLRNVRCRIESRRSVHYPWHLRVCLCVSPSSLAAFVSLGQISSHVTYILGTNL